MRIAMEDLIEKNMGLVLTIVNKFNPKNQTEKEEFIQAGRIGLWKALTKFSENGGSKFSPYAWNPIRWEIIKEINSIKGKKHIEFAGSGKDVELYAQQRYGRRFDTDPVKTNKTEESTFWELLPNSLTEVEREIIILKLAGYTFKEISTKLNQTRANVKKLFDSSVNKIRETNKHE